MASADTTFVIVVAVEQYPGLGDPWTLPGITQQAAEFAEWAIQVKVIPAANFRVFLGGGDRKLFLDLGIGAAQIEDASSPAVNFFLSGVGECWPEGELLLMYWVGHGFVSRDGERRLILGDAKTELKTNLDVKQLVTLLRSDSAGPFRKQIAFVDACAKFFEELQSSTSLPAGGLNAGAQRAGTEQFFYFAASSGEYATQSAFGPQLLEVLRQAPGQVPPNLWPPDMYWVRDRVREVFNRLLAERKANQQPSWLEYREDFDNVSTRGSLPTLDDIHFLSQRSGFPVAQLRRLTLLASNCSTLADRLNRDQLYLELGTPQPLNRPAGTAGDLRVDLMRLVGGAIEQGRIKELGQLILELEGNSDEAFRFNAAITSVDLVRSFWPALGALSIPIERALALFRQVQPLQIESKKPESLDQVIELLIDLPIESPLVEFLARAAKEKPADAAGIRLQSWLDAKAQWRPELDAIEAKVDEQKRARQYLMVEIGSRAGIVRVTQSWLWRGGEGRPKQLASVDASGNLPSDVAALLSEAGADGGQVFLEILAPAELLHLDRGVLAKKIYTGRPVDPEHRYPTSLRWLERMSASARVDEYQTALWKRTAKAIREQLRLNRRVYLIGSDFDPDFFRLHFERGETGELMCVPWTAVHEEIVGIICAGGLPFACWPRMAALDQDKAKLSIAALMNQYSFDDLPSALQECRVLADHLLKDVLLLWDDPERNPYDPKFAEVT